MDKINNIFKSQLGIFLHKIFNDILVLLLISCAMLLVAEGILPGLVSSYLSFTKLTILVFALLGIIIYLGKLNEINFEFKNKKTALLGSLIIFAVTLIVNSLLKFTWFEIAIITIASIFLLFYLYRNFQES